MESRNNKETEDPWVCPNDRELSLRAKLESGWSFYTNRQHSHKKLAIPQDEVAVIENIIQKAEKVTVREEYRIGRLVDRLENIKNNAQGNGVTTCLLCDEKFGKISASPMKCNICEKAACSKCGVDTMSSGNVPIFLCKLCNEQREFLKKSGAWFFGQPPRHKLPSARERHYLSSGSFIVPTPELNSKKVNLLSQASELYSDSEAESSPSSEEILEDDHHHFSRHPKMRGRHSDLQERSHRDSLHGENAEQGSDFRDGHSSHLSLKFNDAASLRSSGTSSPVPAEQSDQQYSPEISDDENGSESSRILHHSPVLVRRKHRDNIDRGRNARLSGSFIQDNGEVAKPERPRSSRSYAADMNDETCESEADTNGPLGAIEFTVNYVKDVRRLDVLVHNAKGLPAMDVSGFSDPYVKAHLLPGASKSNKTRTRTLRKTLDPIFNETLTYHGITEDDMKTKILRLQVLDEDKLKRSDFIGQTTVALKEILLTNNRKLKKVLQPKSELEEDDVVTPRTSSGRIQIALRYASNDSKLYVRIIRCSNLLSMDSNGYSDPYVKCYLLPDPSKKTKRRTKVKKRNLNPEFNEEFAYKIAHNELASRTLEITVWDHDVGKSNDFIGGVHLGIHSKDSLLKHWFETLKFPNKDSIYWHTLTKDVALHEAD